MLIVKEECFKFMVITPCLKTKLGAIARGESMSYPSIVYIFIT